MAAFEYCKSLQVSAQGGHHGFKARGVHGAFKAKGVLGAQAMAAVKCRHLEVCQRPDNLGLEHLGILGQHQSRLVTSLVPA